MDDPLRPHTHDNNITPPNDYANDTCIILLLPDETTHTLTIAHINRLPQATVQYSYTTDHGTHGPYKLQGALLKQMIAHYWPHDWSQLEVISADQFGNRIDAAELTASPHQQPILCTISNGRPLTHAHGLIRLVVPSETDNALRQIKWVHHIRVIAPDSPTAQ